MIESPKFKNSVPDGLKWQEVRPVNSTEVVVKDERKVSGGGGLQNDNEGMEWRETRLL